MEKLIIYEDEWGYGNDIDSCLYDPVSKKKCCLGFESLRLGFSLSEISMVPSPADFIFEREGNCFPKSLVNTINNTPIAKDLMRANDTVIGGGFALESKAAENQFGNKEIVIENQEHRKQIIKDLFALIDVDVEYKPTREM